MNQNPVLINRMISDDIEEACKLVARAMNPDEGRWARKTMEYHFACADADIDDGRNYYVWRQSTAICGLVGLHHYIWGPEQNVWLSWFVVDPKFQNQGNGRKLLRTIENVAEEMGYKKLFVETYAHKDFEKALGFYLSQGFTEAGRIKNYLDDGSEMIIFRKEIEKR